MRLAQDDEPSAIVVIGASAGGLEVLRHIVSMLPAEFPAAICIVLHIAPESPSALGPILQRSGRLPCHAATQGEKLRAGQILVAPPDRHLIIEDSQVKLSVGPRENGHRPAVDPLFRSAAAGYGPRVIGVVLSGTRDDGAAGLAAIKASGGAAVVQDPKEALYAGMPSSALAHVKVDAVLPSPQIAGALVAMVNQDPPPSGNSGLDASAGTERLEDPAAGVSTICPDCGGVLSERTVGAMTQWECRVGHRYSPESLADAQAHEVESALWAAIRALEDREALLERMAAQAEARGQRRSARAFGDRARAAAEHAKAVRRALGGAASTALRSVESVDDGGDAGEESVA